MVAVGSDHDLRRALDRIAETAASLTGARRAAVGIHDEDGRPGDLITHGASPEAEPPIGASLKVPIRVQGELFGTLHLAGKDDGEEFGDGDLHLVRVLATEAGIALSNARLHSAARQRRRWIDGAASVTTALPAGLGTRSTATNALTVVAEQGRELAEATTGAVLLPHAEGGMEVVAISTVLSESVQFVGPVDARVDDRSGRELVTALGEVLATVGASAPSQPARVSVVVDATATLPDGRAGVRLTVSCPDGSHPTLTWERPLKGRSGS
ncbi:GAF domain-containing protein [Streptomyces nigrescens]